MTSELINGSIELSYGRVWLDDNIVVIELRANTLLTATKAEEMRQACVQLKPNEKFLCLVKVGPGASTDSTIMPYVKDPKNTVSKAQAILLSNSLQVIFLNFYIRIMRNINEVRAFTNQQEALTWLKSR